MIAGENGPLRQYVVEGLLCDPENVVVAVDLLTPDEAKSARQVTPSDPRCEHHRIAADDVRNIAEIVAACAPEAIINLTAECVADALSGPTQASSRNIIGTTNLLEAARHTMTHARSNASGRAPPRFIQVFCSDYVDDLDRSAGDLGELSNRGHDSGSRGPADTIIASRMVEQSRQAYGVPAIYVTAANTFGPFQSLDHFVPRTIDALIRQREIQVRCETRNWVFVEDAADAIIFLSQHGVPGRPYAVDGIGARHSDLAIAELICDQLDQLTPREDGSYRDFLFTSPAIATSQRPDVNGAQRLRVEFDWKPLNYFHCALAATVRWYVEQSTWWEHSAFVLQPELNHAVHR